MHFDLPPQYVVVWRTTEVCDLDCGFCSYRRSNHFRRHVSEREEVLRFGLLLADWAQLRGRLALLSWLGGEPLLWPSLLEVCIQLRAAGLATSVTTNGRLFAVGGLSLRDLAAALSEITISIDGRGDTHDHSRRERGLYDRVLSCVAELSDFAPRIVLRANILLTKISLPEVGDILNDCATAGIRQVSFNTLWLEENHPLAALKLDNDDISKFSRDLKLLRLRFRGKCDVLGAASYVERLAAYARGIAVLVEDCNPGAATLFIDSQGKVAPCAYTGSDYGIDLSNIRTVEDIDALPWAFRSMRSSHLANACHDCPDTNVFGKFELVR